MGAPSTTSLEALETPPQSSGRGLFKHLAYSRSPYKKRFLIRSGKKLLFRNVTDVAYFFADGKEVYLVPCKDSRRYLIDYTLEALEKKLDPVFFFRISRKFIVNIESVAEVKGMVSTRLQVRLNQLCEHELHVSRDRSMAFKQWLDY